MLLFHRALSFFRTERRLQWCLFIVWYMPCSPGNWCQDALGYPALLHPQPHGVLHIVPWGCSACLFLSVPPASTGAELVNKIKLLPITNTGNPTQIEKWGLMWMQPFSVLCSSSSSLSIFIPSLLCPFNSQWSNLKLQCLQGEQKQGAFPTLHPSSLIYRNAPECTPKRQGLLWDSLCTWWDSLNIVTKQSSTYCIRIYMGLGREW